MGGGVCGWVWGCFQPDQNRSGQIKGDQGRSKEINVICPTRSKQIRTDQRGSRQIKGDQCDLWVGVRGVGVFQIKGSGQIKGDQGRCDLWVGVRGVGVCVGVFQTRSKQIRTDQRGSRQIKGDQCDLWVGVRGVGVCVGGCFQPDQSRSGWIKGDQGRSKEINVICG